MTLNVESQASRAYGAQLAGTHEAVETAKSYVRAYGEVDLHKKGVIGFLFGGHRHYGDALTARTRGTTRVGYGGLWASWFLIFVWVATGRASASSRRASEPGSCR